MTKQQNRLKQGDWAAQEEAFEPCSLGGGAFPKLPMSPVSILTS